MPEAVTGSSEAALIPFADEPYLQHFSSLTSPVPDFAATLSAQAEQDAEDDNIRFLRSQALTDDEQESRENNEGRQRDHIPSDLGPASRRYTPAQLWELNELEERAQQIVQEYNGWAPGTSDDDDEDPRASITGSASTFFDEQSIRRDDTLRDRMRIRRFRDHFATQAAEGTSRHLEYVDPPLRHPSRFVENGMGRASASTDSSLRATAMLHAVRQNTDTSLHSRSQLQRYILDRERLGLHAEERDRQVSNSSASQLSPSQRRQVQREQSVRQEIQHHRELLAEQAHHRSFLEEQLRQQQQRYGPPPSTEHRRRRMWQNSSMPCPPTNGMSIDNTIRYLDSLTLCESDKEGLEAADESGFNPKDLLPHHVGDFLLDTTLIPPPPSTSWLQVGSVLSGTQHAVPASSVPFNSIGRFASESRSRIRHPTFGTSTARTTSPVRSSSSNSVPALPPHLQARHLRQQRLEQQQLDEDRWPVKVTIHSIDHETMTLAGTMEALNVPDKSSPTNKSSITSYLEGEIIDFNTFTLETKRFQASSRVDATYWRKLPPFRDLKDEETVIKSLLSQEWLKRELMDKWVLMRWKEKQFVTPSDTNSSLTINGFYYITMRRYDGHVEGLYYDPRSTPYQHLSLKPEMRTFPAFEFR